VQSRPLPRVKQGLSADEKDRQTLARAEASESSEEIRDRQRLTLL